MPWQHLPSTIRRRRVDMASCHSLRVGRFLRVGGFLRVGRFLQVGGFLELAIGFASWLEHSQVERA